MTDAAGRGYIGGGSIAAILGLSPFSSPLQAYLEITGEMPQEITPEQAEFFEDRRDLEPWAAKKFTRKTGLRIVRQNVRYDDASFSWAKAEIDFEPENDSNGETKSVNQHAAWRWGDPDSEEPPYYVTAQGMWGMGVRPAERCYVQALIGFDDHRIYVVERNDELIADIREHARRFWEHYVVPRRQPAPTTDDDVKRLYKRDSGRSVEASTAVQLALAERDKAVRAIKLHKNHKKLQELEIQLYMRDATTLTVGGMDVASWRARTDGVRVFRVR